MLEELKAIAHKLGKDITDILDELDEVDIEELYDNMLDESDLDIAGLKYSPSYVLYTIDHTAYVCGVNDYIDSLIGDTIFEYEGGYYNIEDVEALIEEYTES